MEEFKNTQFETKTDKETVSFLISDTEKGLTEAEAKARLEKYGPNKLEEKKKKSWVRIFFEQMANPMIYVLFGAVAITLVFRFMKLLRQVTLTFLILVTGQISLLF